MSGIKVGSRCSNYSILEVVKNVITIICNKLQFGGKVRLVRYPVIIRGKKYIDFGKQLTTGYYCRIEVNGKHKEKVLLLGENVNIGDNVSIRCAHKITIGNNVLLGSRVLIIDNSHGSYSGMEQDNPNVAPNVRPLVGAPICIEDNVWIGEGSVIQMGVTIGKGSIIAANSVVTHNVAAETIVGGVPARELKKYNYNTTKWEKGNGNNTSCCVET